jgi:hydrogenase maturation protease
MMAGQTLFIGLGSRHGDDQIGLRIAEEVGRVVGCLANVRLAGSPASILDLLEARDRVMICDACIMDAPSGTLHRWDWPTSAIQQSRFAGTHDLILPAALALAEALGQFPENVTIWGVAVKESQPGAELSPVLTAAIPQIVERICQSLHEDERGRASASR